MIKLKDIHNKIVKDNSLNEAKRYLNTLTEAEKKVKTVKDAKKHITWLRKMIAKYFISGQSAEYMAKHPKIQPIFRKYLKTGSISNNEVKQVFMFVKRLFVTPTSLLGVVGLWTVIGLSAILYFPLVYLVMYLVFSDYKVQKHLLPLDSKQAKEWNLDTAFKYEKWWAKKISKIKAKTGSWKF